eukprot:3141834-Prymnesium_polylepis.1
MAKLANVLLTLEAADEDVLFFDFLSNPQEAKMGRKYDADEPFQGAPARSATAEKYFEHDRVAFISGRTVEEEANFRAQSRDIRRVAQIAEIGEIAFASGPPRGGTYLPCCARCR